MEFNQRLEEKRLEILDLHTHRKFSKLKSMLNELNPADIALLLEEFEPDIRLLCFRLLTKENAADTFIEFDTDTQESLIHTFSDSELREVLDELYIDDTVDVVEEMPANLVKRILKNSDSDTRDEINTLLRYPKDSAGSIMTTEYVDLKKDMTVEAAFKRIRRTGVDKETIYTCYVVDEGRHLIGVTTVKELLLHDYDDVIDEFMEKKLIYLHTLDDKEEAAQYFDKYDFLAMPVCDMEKRLVGIITVDDAMDVLQDENTEDIQKMAAIVPTDTPYLKTNVFNTWKKRIPWLMLLMVSATFTGLIITKFEGKLASAVVLTSFIPMLMDTGGNSGSQASVTVIRSLSLNELVFKDIFKVIWKEIRVGIACGVSLAVVNFGKMFLVDRLMMGNTAITINVALVISFTLVVEIIFAKVVGCSLPMIAKKIGFDPAVMASPFITTIVDALSLLVYFQFASMILKI